MEKDFVIDPDINVSFRPERDHETGRIVSENAVITRKYAYTSSNGKRVESTMSVDVRGRSESFLSSKPPFRYEVNWSSYGSLPLTFVVAHAEVVEKAIEVAERLTKAYVVPLEEGEV